MVESSINVTAIATGTSIKIDAETMLYVPQDDRPVSLQYTVVVQLVKQV